MFDNLDCGAANRSTMFVKSLSKIGSVNVVSFYKEPIKSNIENCKVIYYNYFEKKNPTKKSFGQRLWENIRNLLFPWNPYYYYPIDERKQMVVDNLISKENYDYVACRYIDEAVSCGLLKYSDKLIIDVDDNLVSAAKRDFGTRKVNNPIKRWYIETRINQLDLMSKYVLNKTKHSFYSNITEPPSSKSIYLPNIPVLTDDIPELNNHVPKKLLIVGWLDFHPNKYGAIHFVKNIFPLVRKKIPDTKLHIIGKCSDQELLDFFNNEPGVSALGFVPNISKEYAECGVVVIPVYSGAGTSVKFIEALKMKRPIVSTPLGVRGLDNICIDKKHYLKANSDFECANIIVSLINSVNYSKSISQEAYDLSKKYFSQEKFIEIVTKEITEKND